MEREQASGRDQTADRSMQRDSPARRRGPRSEALHIRSYDHQWAYDLDVELVTDDGETVFQERYYLLPGDTASEASIAPTGNYHLRVTVDNNHEETLDCRIDSTPDHTAVIEVGNGIIALTEGLQS